MEGALSGIRIVEVASWTFVPGEGAILAEWGADVIKVEDPERGDPLRGLVSASIRADGGVNPMLEIANRGKRSVGIDISQEAGREILYQLIATADVFVTSHLPAVRRRLGIDLDQIRQRCPEVIYVRGSANGPKGNEATRGGFDSASYWARGGVSDAMTDPGVDWPVARPSFGDMVAGLALAGGISAALLRRERTGVASVVDVALLGVGVWNISPDVTSAGLSEDREVTKYARDEPANPLSGTYRTSDGRFISIAMFQFDRFWPTFCEHLDRTDLIADPRFKDAPARYANRRENFAILNGIFGTRTQAHWCERFKTIEGVWAPVRKPGEVHDDAQVIANGYLQTIVTNNGRSLTLPANPVQFDENPPSVAGAPGHGEHTDAVLLELGISMEEIMEHKISGVLL